MAIQPLNNRALNRALLARQGLLKRQRLAIADLLHRVGGLQSQEPRRKQALLHFLEPDADHHAVELK